MTRNDAKALFRNDKDVYGKPKAIMSKIDRIFDDFEAELAQLKLEEIKDCATCLHDSKDSTEFPCWLCIKKDRWEQNYV